jgi:protein-disulfide isomerase
MTKEQRTQIWGAAAFLIVIIGVMIVAGVYSAGQKTGIDPSFKATKTDPITTTDHTRGNSKALVNVVEYGDFQCPACGAYEPLVEQVSKAYGDKVLLVFRNFPLVQVHANAMLGAQAAEAAGIQGKYWEMHALLYAKQKEWSEGATDAGAKLVDTYAQSLGLDMTKFHSDMSSKAVADKIQADITSATIAQVDHTPTFFINLTQIKNPNNYDEFKSALDTALASSTPSK